MKLSRIDLILDYQNVDVKVKLAKSILQVFLPPSNFLFLIKGLHQGSHTRQWAKAALAGYSRQTGGPSCEGHPGELH